MTIRVPIYDHLTGKEIDFVEAESMSAALKEFKKQNPHAVYFPHTGPKQARKAAERAAKHALNSVASNPIFSVSSSKEKL